MMVTLAERARTLDGIWHPRRTKLKKRAAEGGRAWSGRRDSNPRRPPWQDNPERFSAFRIVTKHEKIAEI
jgi:hypothetical protein